MTSRAIVTAALVVSTLLYAASLPTEAQHAGKIYRIGVLEIVRETSNTANLAAFREGLSSLGYVEGKSYVIDYRSADERTERLQDLATELVRLNVDVIVTRGTPAALSAKQATSTIPIVMASSGDPAAEGVVASLARPGGNVTGFHTMGPFELGRKRLQLLKEAVPGASRVGILVDLTSHYSPLIVKDTESVARAMGVQLKTLEVRGAVRFGPAFEAALMFPVDAMIAVEDSQMLTKRAEIVEFAAMSRLPAIYGLREFVDAGGLMSYGTDRRDLFRRSATYVHKILAGARPGDLPIERPTSFELAINLRTAEALGLAFPPSLLQRADYVVR
jgi:putative tryptophan/tyrosine transport system substrate-binding protein